ncbi:MAG: transcriptional regulator BetI [Rhodobacteraceae bacterium]|nr:transcriptional regulator BetI [Paracoccaceae bacterium]
MPKVGMEPVRRAALVDATIGMIGEAGSLDVTVGQIAKRAGVSTALAHHYFGGKDQIFLAAMRHILSEYSAEVRLALKSTSAPQDRLAALIAANFSPTCFKPTTVNAWLNFYVQAQSSEDAARLLRIYQRRLDSNLRHALRAHLSDPTPVVQALAAMIDGVYLRAALSRSGLKRDAAQQVLSAARALIAEQKQ